MSAPVQAVDSLAAGRGQGAIVRFQSVSRTYPRGHVRALRHVSLAIEAESYLAITGPSGSGKSTFLYLATGLDRPDQGEVLFAGRAPASPVEWTRLRATQIGFVFQTFQLIAGLTAIENVELPMLGVLSGQGRRRQRAQDLLARVGLVQRASHRITELSGGEAQRVAIARALANCPRILLADEPTGNLDSETAGQILQLLEDINRQDKVTLVVVTHDQRIAARAGRVITLCDGQIAADQYRRSPA